MLCTALACTQRTIQKSGCELDIHNGSSVDGTLALRLALQIAP